MKPLKGVCVLLLRPKLGSEAKKLKSLGAQVIHSPVLKLCPTRYPLSATLYPFHWIVFTSSSAVHFFKRRCKKLPASLKIAAIGPKTAQVISKLFKRRIDFMPSVYTTEALARELPLGTDAAAGDGLGTVLGTDTLGVSVPSLGLPLVLGPSPAAASVPDILLVRSKIADKRLEAILARRGASFKRISPYAIKEKSLKVQVKQDMMNGKITHVFFGSASQARSFAKNFAPRELRKIFAPNKIQALAIGPETSKALKKFAIPHKVSPNHTFDGLIDLLAER